MIRIQGLVLTGVAPLHVRLSIFLRTCTQIDVERATGTINVTGLIANTVCDTRLHTLVVEYGELNTEAVFRLSAGSPRRVVFENASNVVNDRCQMDCFCDNPAPDVSFHLVDEHGLPCAVDAHQDVSVLVGSGLIAMSLASVHHDNQAALTRFVFRSTTIVAEPTTCTIRVSYQVILAFLHHLNHQGRR